MDFPQQCWGSSKNPVMWSNFQFLDVSDNEILNIKKEPSKKSWNLKIMATE